MGYIVWGRLHNTNKLIKLHHEEKRNSAVLWIERNKMYYEDMRIYKSR